MHWWTLIRRYLDFFTTCLVGYLNYQYTRRFTKRKPRDNLSPIDDVTKIGPNVIRILGQNPGPFTLQGTNTYLVGSNNKMILIDAGEPDNPRYIDKLRSALGMASIEGIICTHWHHDHLGGCHSVRKHFRTSKGELPPVYKKNRNSAAENGFCEYIGDSHVIKQDNVTLKILDTKPNVRPDRLPQRPKRGSRFKILSTTPLSWWWTGGHTSDHISVLYEEESILFSGDCILGEGSTIFEDLGDYMDSLRRLLLLDCKTICPGHGPLITNPKAKIEEYIERREERDRQILKFLCEVERANSLEVTRTLYKGLPKNVHVAAFRSVQLHLKKLERERKVKRIGLIDYALVSKLTPPVSTQSFMCER